MRYALIGCDVLFRECCLAAAQSPAVIDFVMLPQGLHNAPADLRTRVQQEIDRLEGGPQSVAAENTKYLPPPQYDAILLGYALCSNGVVGLTSSRVPLVIPRGHDCVTLLLGSKEAYREYFESHRGVYWYSAGWIERTIQPGKERWEFMQRHYVDTYGEENAEYLMEMEQGWFKEYEWATFINWNLPTAERDRQYTRDCAAFLGWNFDEVQGDPTLMYDFLAGVWDEQRFLIAQPGEAIEPTNDPSIVRACPGCDCHGVAQFDACVSMMSNTLHR